MPGYATPPCRLVDVVVGEVTEVVGEYGRFGLLKVEVEPAGLPSTIFVDGEPRDEYGLFAFTEPGPRTVCWGDVDGFQSPACQEVGVVAGEQSTVTGTFVPSASPPPGPAPDLGEFGYLRVTTNPPVVSRVIVDDIPRSDWSLSSVKFPTGTHEVCFSDVVGYATPPCRTVRGDFARLGLLKVEVEPAGLPVDVVVDGVPRNQFGAFLFLEPGSYEVCGTDLSGWTTPGCSLVVVESAFQSTVQLTYVES